MMKFLMDKYVNKYGYISVEIVIIVAIILIGGLIGINKYASKGKKTTSKTNEKVEKTIAFANGTVAEGSGKNDGSGTNNWNSNQENKQNIAKEKITLCSKMGKICIPSDEPYTISFKKEGIDSLDDCYFQLQIDENNFVVGDEYTLSFDIRGMPNNAFWIWYIDNDRNNKSVKITDNKHYSITFKMPSEGNHAKNTLLFDDRGAGDNNNIEFQHNMTGIITFYNIKLVKN